MWTWECECVENKNVEKKNVRNLWFTSFSFVLAALVIIFFPFFALSSHHIYRNGDGGAFFIALLLLF